MIRPERLLARLDDLARIGGTRAGGVDRPALSETDRQARQWLAALAHARGFTLHTDGLANLFIRRAGGDPALAPVLIGSHLDSQPSGGRFDGALGTLCAFECLEALEDRGIATRHPVEVVAWTNEEGSRFAPGTMGSMAFAGKARAQDWHGLADAAGVRFADELAATLAALPQAALRRQPWTPRAYLELHIEQGPVLEATGATIGAVTGVQGVRWFNVTVEGEAAHAGTTPPAYRRDALAAAVRILAGLEPVMVHDEDARVTCGRIAVEPGSVNAIASRAVFTLDTRHPDPAVLDRIEGVLNERARDEAKVQVRIERTLDMPPCRFDGAIVRAIEAAADGLDLPHRRLPSGAFHDALHLVPLCPTGMIFVPCRGGVSHNEAEFVEPEHALAGAEVLLAVTRGLAG